MDADLIDTLERKRVELDEELSALSAAPVDTGGISFGKRVGDGTSVAVERLAQVAAFDRLQALREDVVRAQTKLAEGSYGTCDRCGERIAGDRLAALPWATLCISCAAAGRT